MDAMTFFQKSAGKWRSQRTTHHLAFRRAELGSSDIFIEALPPDNPKVIEICQLHEVDPSLTVGGAFVSWDGTMDWDKKDENHKGTTVFALIPDTDNPKKGILLRERGYAEIVPIAGQYQIDEEGALILVTEYETMSSVERFWFPSPNIRMRTSAVQRFGGFNSATCCTEMRVEEETVSDSKTEEQIADNLSYSLTGW